MTTKKTKAETAIETTLKGLYISAVAKLSKLDERAGLIELQNTRMTMLGLVDFWNCSDEYLTKLENIMQQKGMRV